jgi:DNA-binding transcriptional regulator YdaS (Cro superfamily)
MTLNEYFKLKRGNAKALAEQMEISPSFLSQLASGEAPISPSRAVLIERVTEGRVSRKDMFPDTWEANWPELAEESRVIIVPERRRKPRRETDASK